MRVWIQPLTGKRFPVTVEPTDEVAHIKFAINSVLKVDAPMQRLIFHGQILKDSATIKECSLQLSEDDHIILFVKQPPPATPTPTVPAASAPTGQQQASPPIAQQFNPVDVENMIRDILAAIPQNMIPPAAPAVKGAVPVGSASARPATIPVVLSGVPVPPPGVAAPKGPLPSVPLVVDTDALNTLTEMGFPKPRSRKALLLNRNNVEAAMEWMLEHANDVDIDVPLTDAQLRALAGLHAPQPSLPPLQNPVDPAVEAAITRNECTFTATGREYRPQYYQHCYTCGFTGNEGACVACIRNCHRGHNVSPPIYSSRFYCDCGAGSRIQCKCMPDT